MSKNVQGAVLCLKKRVNQLVGARSKHSVIAALNEGSHMSKNVQSVLRCHKEEVNQSVGGETNDWKREGSSLIIRACASSSNFGTCRM